MSTTNGSSGCFTDPLGGLPDREWDEMAGPRFYSTALWLRLCALAPGSTSGGLHLELPGGGRCAVPVAAVRDEPNGYLRWHELLGKLGLPRPPAQGILVGQRRGYLAHLLTTPGADRAAAVSRLLATARGLRLPWDDRSDPVSADRPPPCVAMYVTTPDALALRAAGVDTMPVALDTDAWIEIPPGGLEAWMDSLGSAHRARNVRREVRRFAQAGYRIERSTLRESYQDVARLLTRTVGRYGRVADVSAMARSFGEQGELAGDRAEVLLCSRDGQPPVGFCLFYRWHDTVFLRAVGFDYEKLSSAAEYFNLTYYLPAGFPGVRRLHAGISTPKAKALRGATLSPLWLVDLSERSVLAGRDEQIRRHNRAFVASLKESSPVVASALQADHWDVFC